MRQSQAFSTTLPTSPLSYDGVIVKIQWCVRIRVFLNRGRDFSGEQSFWLGQIPRGQVIEQDATVSDEDSQVEPQPGIDKPS